MPFFQTPNALLAGPAKIDYACPSDPPTAADLTFTVTELATFITIMHRAAYPTPLANDLPQPVFTAVGPTYFLVDQPSSSPHVSSRVLYTNIFRHFVVPNPAFPTLPSRAADGTIVLRTNSGILDTTNIANDIRTTDINLVGQFMEGANLFTIWLTRLRFQTILSRIYQLTVDTPANVIASYNNILTSSLGFFSNMRSLLVQNPVTLAARLEDPLLPSTKTGQEILDALKKLSRILYPDKLPFGEALEADDLLFTHPRNPRSYCLRALMRSYNSSLSQAMLLGILRDLYAESSAFINTLSSCIYNSLGGFGDCRDFTRAASGDGRMGQPENSQQASGTQGILNIPDAGVLFFPYSLTSDMVGGNLHVYPSPEQTTSISLLGGNGRNRVVHIGLYGVDPSDTFTVTVSSGVPGSPTMVFKDGTGNDEGTLVPRDQSVPANGQVIFRKTDGTPYARFNNNTKDLIIFDNTATRLTLKLVSGDREIFLSAASFCQVTGVVPINLTGTFGDDRFEFTTGDYNTYIIPAIGNAALNDIITLLLDPTTVLTSSLLGGFVGMPDPRAIVGGPQISSDPDYAFSKGPRTGDGHRDLERSSDEPGDAALRYSFGRISYSNPLDPPLPPPAATRNVDFLVWSYTSPVYSRLDKRFLGPALDGNGNPVNDLFDFRNNDTNPTNRTGPDLTLLKQHTVFGMAGENIANTDAYIIDTNVLPSNPNYYIPSYNQVLSGLRSFGVLEAIFFRIIQYTNLTQPANTAAVRNRLLTFLKTHADPNCPQTNTGFFPPNQKVLFYDDTTLFDGYRDLKWYTSLADMNNHNRLEP